jgi:hypothetical protein
VKSKGGRPRKPEQSVLLAFRLPETLVERLDAHVERLAAERPGSAVTRADALRALLLRGLDEAEATHKR